MNIPLLIIFTTIALDALGISLIIPILPNLLASLNLHQDTALAMGLLTACYALMQLVFAPVMGALSDRLGRKPVLLVSLAGMVINYLILAFANSFAWLLIGRLLAGITSANMAVASAYLTDITPADKRAARFGKMNAMFGLGFILGPVVGGLLGEVDLRLPFIAAAGLNAATFLLAFKALPESRQPSKAPLRLAQFNPLASFANMLKNANQLPLVLTFFVLSATGEAYGICWALWGQDTFGWNAFWVGLSLGAFGICQTLVQAFGTSPATRKLGERGAVLMGVGCACIALTVMAFAQQGWIVFAIMPIFALSSIGSPALQAIATRQVDETRQGELQGILTSAVSLASVIAPLGFSGVYFAVQHQWPGAIWLSVVVLYVIAIPLLWRSTQTAPAQA